MLEAWRHWGPDALPRFRGMFAFAIADTATGELALARDPLGIKPLLYLRRGSGIVFASELKALVAARRSGAAGSSRARWSRPCSITGCRSSAAPIQGVRKLPAGSWACFRPDGTHEEHAYWRVQDVARGGGPGSRR